MSKEPVAFWAIISAVIVALLGRVGIDWIDGTMVEGFLKASAVLVGAYMARRKAVPVATVNEAGMTTDDLKAMAADTRITPVVEGEG